MHAGTEILAGHGEQALDSFVEPIRTLEHIQAIKNRLADAPRDLLLFTLGINNGLRAGDFLRLTANHVRDVQPGQSVAIREKKTGQANVLVVHPEAWDALQRHLQALDPPQSPGNMYLFASQRGWSPLTTQRLDEMVRDWTRKVGLAGTYGAHTLRKTFGYIQRTHYGVGFEVLARRFNHPSPSFTQRYLGITGDDIDGIPLGQI